MAEGDNRQQSAGNLSPSSQPTIYNPSTSPSSEGQGTKSPAPSQPEPEGRRPAPQKEEPGSSAKH